MRGNVSEVLRLLRNPAAIVVVLLLIGSGEVAPRLAPSPGPDNSSTLDFGISYNYSSAYKFSIVAFNGVGTSVSGATARMTFFQANSSGPSLGEVMGETDNRGHLTMTWSHGTCRCVAEFSLHDSKAGVQFAIPISGSPPSKLSPLINPFWTIQPGFFVARPALLVAFANDSGGVPPGTFLEYCIESQVSPSAPCSPISLGALTGIVETVPIGSFGKVANTSTVNLSLAGPGDVLIASDLVQYSALNQNLVANAEVTGEGTSLQAGVLAMSFVVALAGSLIGYVAYGRDRLGGSLEAVLALPISRRKLILSRYWAAAITALIGSTGGAIVVGMVLDPPGGGMPLSIWFDLAAALGVEAIIFVGIAFAGAHLTRSASLLLTGLMLFSLFPTILWTPLIGLIVHIGNTSPNGVLTSTLISINPAEVAAQILAYPLSQMVGGPPNLLPTLQSWGVSASLLLAWVVLPILLAWCLFRIRD
jgi:ABC-type transport system involved in multi-copper enzyme maturation permease subunit